MRRQISASHQLYSTLYPRPTASDPPNFSAYLARCLIPEIRIETARFYGSLDSTEARYPGLNYTYPPHIKRLSSFPNHQRLFHAIKELGLTSGEVLDLVRWEGTLWARERFEKDEKTRVRDTTGQGIGRWVDPRVSPRKPLPVIQVSDKGQIRATTVTTMTTQQRTHWAPSAGRSSHVLLPSTHTPDIPTPDTEDCYSDSEHIPDGPIASPSPSPSVDHESATSSTASGSDEDEEEEEETGSLGEQIESIGHDLNRRLLEAVTRRERGEQVDMDPEFEAYLKEQIENGSLSRWISAVAQRLGQNGGATGSEHTLPAAINFVSAATVVAASASGVGRGERAQTVGGPAA